MIDSIGKGRTCYTEYVAHMIRFYIASPESIDVQGHTQAEVKNWMAVQAVFADMDPEDQRLLTDIFRRKSLQFPDAVRVCAIVHERKENDAWKLIAMTNTKIARMRGLI